MKEKGKKKWLLIAIVLSVLLAGGCLFAVDHSRMKQGKPVVFSTWGKEYAPEEAFSLKAVILELDAEAKIIRVSGPEATADFLDEYVLSCDDTMFEDARDPSAVKPLKLEELQTGDCIEVITYSIRESYPAGTDPERIRLLQREDIGAKRDFKAVQERLAGYPDTYEELLREDAYVILHGEVKSGQDKWDRFYQNVQNQIPAEIVLIQFTDEGDAILTYLYYDGNDFYAVEDDSRDAFAGAGERYWEKQFKYLKIFEEAVNGESARSIMLLDDNNLTWEDIKKSWLSSSSEGHVSCYYVARITLELED